MSLRKMIGRSFATEDAHDKIRAAVVDLFEVLELEGEADIDEVGMLVFFSVVRINRFFERKKLPPIKCAAPKNMFFCPKNVRKNGAAFWSFTVPNLMRRSVMKPKVLALERTYERPLALKRPCSEEP